MEFSLILDSTGICVSMLHSLNLSIQLAHSLDLIFFLVFTAFLTLITRMAFLFVPY